MPEYLKMGKMGEMSKSDSRQTLIGTSDPETGNVYETTTNTSTSTKWGKNEKFDSACSFVYKSTMLILAIFTLIAVIEVTAMLKNEKAALSDQQVQTKKALSLMSQILTQLSQPTTTSVTESPVDGQPANGDSQPLKFVDGDIFANLTLVGEPEK